MKIDGNQSIIKACKKLIEEYHIEYIVAKKGDKGITIVGEDNFVKHIKPHNVENPDVTGAGDTVISVLASALASNKTLKKSCELANIAAGLSIQHLGTVSISKSDINNAIRKS